MGAAAEAAVTTVLRNVIIVLTAKRLAGMWPRVSFSLSSFRKAREGLLATRGGEVRPRFSSASPRGVQQRTLARRFVEERRSDEGRG
jgi:hypothetical protein